MFKMLFTRSQSRKTSMSTPLNAKGHPTIGMICPRPAPKMVVNPYISQCDTLEKTAEMFEVVTEMAYYIIECDSTDCKRWVAEIYRKLFDFVNRDMKPTFDEIDAMLLVCRILLERKMKDEVAEFILNCPDKFLLTYVNNSESSPTAFYKLRKLGLENICNYLLPHVHNTKLGTWNERINTHIHGNVSFECDY